MHLTPPPSCAGDGNHLWCYKKPKFSGLLPDPLSQCLQRKSLESKKLQGISVEEVLAKTACLSPPTLTPLWLLPGHSRPLTGSESWCMLQEMLFPAPYPGLVPSYNISIWLKNGFLRSPGLLTGSSSPNHLYFFSLAYVTWFVSRECLVFFM